MKVNVYSIKGQAKGDIELPAAFEAEVRPDLVRKTVNAYHANRRQPYGSDPMAGKKHSQYSWRSGQGASRVPRLSQGSRAVLSPAVVGGRRAHPPKVDKNWSEKVNVKERRKAFAGALAATASPDLVRARGHRFKDGLSLPVVVEDAFASIAKASEVIAALEALGVGGDLVRAKDGRKQKPGIAKLRGRRIKTPKSVLIVVEGDSPVLKAAANLSGVDVLPAKEINTETVAPGGDVGRLTVFTTGAIREIMARTEGDQ